MGKKNNIYITGMGSVMDKNYSCKKHKNPLIINQGKIAGSGRLPFVSEDLVLKRSRIEIYYS
jgi:hypothetical protein